MNSNKKFIPYFLFALFLIAGIGEGIFITHKTHTVSQSTKETINPAPHPFLYKDGLHQLSNSFVARIVKSFSEPNVIGFKNTLKPTLHPVFIQNETIAYNYFKYIHIYYKRLLLYPFLGFW